MPAPRGTTRHVLDLLREHGPATSQDLRAHTGRSERMVRYALEWLQRQDLVRCRHDLRDSRRRVYVLASEAPVAKPPRVPLAMIRRA